MLLYSPALDACHSVFRALAIAEHLKKAEADKVRILDFYLLFPGLIREISLPAGMAKARAESKKAANIYRDPPDPRVTFRALRELHTAAFQCLASANLIDPVALNSGYIERVESPVPSMLRGKLQSYLESTQPASGIVLDELAALPLMGVAGLKRRTSLMEYRYDDV